MLVSGVRTPVHVRAFFGHRVAFIISHHALLARLVIKCVMREFARKWSSEGRHRDESGRGQGEAER